MGSRDRIQSKPSPTVPHGTSRAGCCSQPEAPARVNGDAAGTHLPGEEEIGGDRHRAGTRGLQPPTPPHTVTGHKTFITHCIIADTWNVATSITGTSQRKKPQRQLPVPHLSSPQRQMQVTGRPCPESPPGSVRAFPLRWPQKWGPGTRRGPEVSAAAVHLAQAVGTRSETARWSSGVWPRFLR